MSELHGTVHWTELMTRDLDAAKAYYEKICGWRIDGMPMGEFTYWVAFKGEDMVAGMMDMTGMPGMDEMPPHWLSYLAVDDVDAAVADTRAAGGQVARDPYDVEGVGRIAIVQDPGGAAIGIMTPSNP